MGFTQIILLVSTLALVDSTPNMFVTVSGDINYDGTNPKVVVNLDGKDRAIVTDQERFKFQLSDDGLKKCVASYKGRRPNDAYVHSPTPWNDLYNRYGWMQVYRTVKPLNATTVNIFTKQETISLKMYNNTQSTPVTGKATISKTFENKLTTTWSEEEVLTVTGEVSVSVSLKVVDVSASTSISKAKSWGKAFEHSQATAITDSAEIEFVVPPHESVYVRTEMSKTLVTVRVEYEARLDGNTAVNYDPAFQGHHFYGLDINDVMRSCRLRTELIVTEDINLDLVTGVKMEVFSDPAGIRSSSIAVEVIDL